VGGSQLSAAKKDPQETERSKARDEPQNIGSDTIFIIDCKEGKRFERKRRKQ